MIEIGSALPNVPLLITGNQTIQLNDLKGKNIVLYFYPRDNTPGCTQEGQDFRDLHEQFKKHNTVIFGISRDKLSSHERFKTKQEFPFELIADEDETLCQLFNVMKDKIMYGKKVRGIERSTFIFNSKGLLCHEWRKVNVKDHATEVLEVISKLKKS